MSLSIPPGFGSMFWEFVGSAGTSPFGFTVGLDLSDAGGAYVDLCNQAMDAYGSNFLDDTSEQLTMTRTVLTIGQDGGTVGSVQSSSPAVAGGRSTDSTPISLSLLIDKRTAGLGRTSRGRFNLPGVVTSSEVDLNGLIDPVHVATYQTAADTFGSELGSGVPGQEGPVVVCTPVLLHSDPSLDPSPIIGIVVSRKVGVLTRRLR